jgi:hypothetical protein
MPCNEKMYMHKRNVDHHPLPPIVQVIFLNDHLSYNTS